MDGVFFRLKEKEQRFISICWLQDTSMIMYKETLLGERISFFNLLLNAVLNPSTIQQFNESYHLPNAAVSNSHYLVPTVFRMYINAIVISIAYITNKSPSGVYEIDIKSQSLYENIYFYIFYV